MNDFPAIDFSNYALLCGRKTYMNCIRLDSVCVVEICNKIQHRVYIREGICGAIVDIYYFTLIPASYANRKVEFLNLEANTENLYD